MCSFVRRQCNLPYSGSYMILWCCCTLRRHCKSVSPANTHSHLQTQPWNEKLVPLLSIANYYCLCFCCCCCCFFFSFFVFVFLLFFFYEYVNVPIIDQVHNNEKLFIKEGEWAYRLQTCHEKQIITCRVSASCFSVRFIFSISAHACYVLLNQSSLFFVMRTVCSLSDGSLTFLCNGF